MSVGIVIPIYPPLKVLHPCKIRLKTRLKLRLSLIIIYNIVQPVLIETESHYHNQYIYTYTILMRLSLSINKYLYNATNIIGN